MIDRLFPHRCAYCGNSYLSADKDRIFCESRCEGHFKYYGKEKKRARLSEEERKAKQIVKNQKAYQKVKMKRELLRKKPKEKKRIDFKSLMYGDTFKPCIPTAVRVMRG